MDHTDHRFTVAPWLYLCLCLSDATLDQSVAGPWRPERPESKIWGGDEQKHMFSSSRVKVVRPMYTFVDSESIVLDCPQASSGISVMTCLRRTIVTAGTQIQPTWSVQRWDQFYPNKQAWLWHDRSLFLRAKIIPPNTAIKLASVLKWTNEIWFL